MERFVAQQSLRSSISEWPDIVDDDLHPVNDMNVKDELLESCKSHNSEKKRSTNSAHSLTILPSHSIKRECDDEGIDTGAKVVVGIDGCGAEGENNPATDEHEYGDNNVTFDDPMNEDPDGEVSAQHHPIVNEPNRGHSIIEDEITFTDACNDIATNHQTPESTGGGIDKTSPGGSVLDSKQGLYSRLSIICRKNTNQSHPKSGKTERKRSLPNNMSECMTNTRKRLRRTFDDHHTSNQGKRDAKISGRRATFPSFSSRVAVETAALESAAKKTCVKPRARRVTKSDRRASFPSSSSRIAVETAGLESAAKKTRAQPPQRKAAMKSDRRATFPSSSKITFKSADLDSAAKKARAVTVIDLFDETESLFGCAVISHANADHRKSRSNEDRNRTDQNEARSGIAFDSPGDNLERSSNLHTTIFDDGEDSLKESSNADVTHPFTYDDTNDQLDGTKDGVEEVISADVLDNTFSISSNCGASFSIGSNKDDQTENKATLSETVLVNQPFFDVYFGREDSQSTLFLMESTDASLVVESQPFHDHYYGRESDHGTAAEESSSFQPPHRIYFGLRDGSDSSMHSNLEMSSLIDLPSCVSSQPFHDHYYGQESFNGLIDNDNARQSLHCVCFGLYDDTTSSEQSQLDFSSLTSPSKNIPHYDYYFGQAECLTEAGGNSVNDETEKAVGSIPKCKVQSQHLFAMVLLAGMLSSAH